MDEYFNANLADPDDPDALAAHKARADQAKAQAIELLRDANDIFALSTIDKEGNNVFTAACGGDPRVTFMFLEALNEKIMDIQKTIALMMIREMADNFLRNQEIPEEEV